MYTIDYSEINKDLVTCWIFGGVIPVGNVWVPLVGIVGEEPGSEEATTLGAITNFEMAEGVTFITPSGKDEPVNYGILNGGATVDNLTVRFMGQAEIGTWAVRPIWYYNIISDGLYLTDALEYEILPLLDKWQGALTQVYKARE